MKMPRGGYPVDKYRGAARAAFQNLRVPMEITDHVDYWRFGCVFDTMTDYLVLLNESPEREDQELLAAYASWVKSEQQKPDWSQRRDPYAMYLRGMVTCNTAWCYDDFCWWGIAFSKVLVYTKLFEQVFGQLYGNGFYEAARAIWKLVYGGDYQAVIDTVPRSYPGFSAFEADFKSRMSYHGGSPNAWARVLNNPAFKARYGPGGTAYAEPRFPGGHWQYDFYWEDGPPTRSLIPEASGMDGNADQNVTGALCLGPFQLTLMSGLMLIYASRLAAWDPSCQPAAAATKQFLAKWFTRPKGGDENLLWHYDPNDEERVLVRERVSSYKDGSPVKGFDPNRAWCGDQGLILGGLVEFYGSNPKKDRTYRVIRKLVAGTLATTLAAKGKLKGSAEDAKAGKPAPLFDGSYGVQPYSPASAGKTWGGNAYLFRDTDYWSGAGVFWRYLFQTFRSNGDVKEKVSKILSSEGNAIFVSAEAATGPWRASGPPYRPWPDYSNDRITSAVGNAWPDQDAGVLFKWFNVLATLTAAIEVMKDWNGGRLKTGKRRPASKPRKRRS